MAALLYALPLLLILAIGLAMLSSERRRRNALKRRLVVAPPRSAEAHTAEKKPRAELAQAAARQAADFYRNADPETVQRVRMQLIRAGYHDPRAVGLFFLTRGAAGIALLAVTFIAMRFLAPDASALGALGYATAAGALGYFLPNLQLSSKIRTRQREYTEGLPDFMDLMIVCADAGMSMEAAIERVSRELTVSYPALGENLQLLSIELRAGRSLEEALRSLSDRLGLDEVRSLAVLLQQSRKLGTSLAQTLRIFSDDMRHKRMAKAEEKAHALPAKMSIPVTMCILPVVMLVATIPVIVKLATGAY
jgi:tight adherence protein C